MKKKVKTLIIFWVSLVLFIGLIIFSIEVPNFVDPVWCGLIRMFCYVFIFGFGAIAFFSLARINRMVEGDD